jgi:hypothetical protein
MSDWIMNRSLLVTNDVRYQAAMKNHGLTAVVSLVSCFA